MPHSCVQLPLFLSGVFFVTGCTLMAAAGSITLLVVGRIFLGVGVGLSSLVRSSSCPRLTGFSKAFYQ